MKLIDRYIIGTLCSSTLYTLFALLSIYTFFDFVHELSSVNQNNYTLPVMVQYVGLIIPSNAYELMPLAVLIGAIIAMTQLAANSEYAVIRSSGITLFQLARTLFLFGFTCTLITVLFGELLAPLTRQQAERMKLQASHVSVAQGFHSGNWIKDGRSFINIREILPDATLLGVHIYSYDSNFRLTHVTAAERATFDRQRRLWNMSHVKQTRLNDTHSETSNQSTIQWHSVIDPSLFNALLVVPEQMSATNLFRYIQHLKSNKQKTGRYAIALWGKAFYPLACIPMALISLAFTPLQRRHSQLNLRLFGGICIGVAFHFINRLFTYLGLLHDWDPVVSATLPTLLFLLIGISIILKQEQR